MSKRVKISFETVNRGNYTVISSEDIAETNKNIREAMLPVIREFKRKEFQSWILTKDKRVG